MSDITAKIVCNGRTESGEGDDRQVTLSFCPDYQDGRNKEWARYTPALSLTMTVRGDVADRFQHGAPFLLTFHQED